MVTGRGVGALAGLLIPLILVGGAIRILQRGVVDPLSRTTMRQSRRRRTVRRRKR